MDIGSLGLAIILLSLALALLSGKFAIDLVALVALIVLVLCGYVQSSEALTGFSSAAVATMCAVFVLSGALRESGVADSLGNLATKWIGRSEKRAIIAIISLAALFSSVMNNIIAAALLLPSVLRISQLTKIPPSITLIPLAFGAILGGMTTLIGTPPNIVSSEILTRYGYAPLSFFSFFPAGMTCVVLGMALLVLIAPRYLPRNASDANTPPSDDLEELYHIGEKLFAVKVPDGSSLVGRSLGDIQLGRTLGCRVVEIQRAEARVVAPQANEFLSAGDRLILRGDVERVRRLKANESMKLEDSGQVTHSSLSELLVESEVAESDLESNEIGLLEVVISPRARIVGQTLRQLNFRGNYGFMVLAILRGGTSLRSQVADIPLQYGDALLLQGPRSRMPVLARNRNFLLLSRIVPNPQRTKRAPVVLLSFLLMILLPLIGIVPFEISALISAVIVVLSGATTMEEGYRDIDWRIIVFTACLIPLGEAVRESQLSSYLLSFLSAYLQDSSPYLGLLVIGILGSIASQLLDGVPAVVILSPIAIALAQAMQVDPHPFVMALALSSSVAFLTPISHKVNLLVMSTGGYKQRDYLAVGLPLSVLCMAIILLVVPMVFPF